MATTPHTIEIVITEDGKITSVTKGVDGPACSEISKWLDSLGTVEEDSQTADYRKPARQGIGNGTRL
jgi:hypothetical protein